MRLLRCVLGWHHWSRWRHGQCDSMRMEVLADGNGQRVERWVPETESRYCDVCCNGVQQRYIESGKKTGLFR